jgi:TolB-like protein/DNA-binding winged helix-turn-helix (wHTH) protein/tetratricopeptide (TPR) repeat protein
MTDREFLEFGRYRFEPSRRVLWRGDQLMSVPLKDLETLLVLLKHPGEVVSKDELLAQVWPGTFIEEANIARHVSNLRALLAEDGSGQTFIETIPKRGYRFTAPVRFASRSSVQPEAIASGPESAAGIQIVEAARVSPATIVPGGNRHAGLRRTWALLVLAVAVAGLVAAYRLASSRVAKPGRIMLLVLPVENLSGHAERDYISDGLTEEIISRLGNMNPRELAVIARTTSMSYRNTNKTVEQIGRELKVDYVLESSLRESSGTFRITTQLIRTSDQTHFWAHDYDGPIGDVLALQKKVATEVAQQIRITLPRGGPSKERNYPNDPRAFDAYLKGRFFWNKRTPEAMSAAVKFFQEAIEIDPNYAAAYTGLSDSYDLQVWFEQLTPLEGFSKARAAALKAVELDDELAEAHTSLASIRADLEWNWPAAEGEFKRALELNPNYATAHHWYAEHLAWMGRFAEAMAEIRKAQELDPLSPVIGATVGEMYCRMDQCENAVQQYKKVLEMHPGFPQAQYLMAEAYARMGKYEKAQEEVGKAQQLPHLSAGWTETTLGYAAAMSGRREEALAQLERLRQQLDAERADYFLAILYASLDDKDRAFPRLDSALSHRDFSMPGIQADYRLANLRSDPRYKSLLRRMNF